MTTHDTHPTPETLDTFIAGGLDAADRDAVDSHLASCPACAAVVADAAAADRAMRDALSSAGPDGGFDDRLIAAVRGAAAAPATPKASVWRPYRLRIHPAVRRAAIAAAAVLVVGTAGYVGTAGINGGFARALANRSRSASNLHQTGLAIMQYDDKDGSAGDREVYKSDFLGGSTPKQSWEEFDSLKKRVEPNGVKNYVWQPSGNDAAFAFRTGPFDGQDSIMLPAANGDGGAGSTPRPLVPRTSKDLVLGLTDGSDGLSTPQRTEVVPKADTAGNGQGSPGNFGPYRVNTDSIALDANPRLGSGGQNSGPNAEITRETRNGSTNIVTGNVSGLNYFHPAAVEPGHEVALGPAVTPPSVNISGGTLVLAPGPGTLPVKPPEVTAAPMPPIFKEVVPGSIAANPGDYPNPGTGTEMHGMPPGQPTITNGTVQLPTLFGSSVGLLEAAATQPAPAVDTRKIIRTGSMEFEVDRFDSAQATISKIVGEAGGFVGTTESQKLPNGKTRGTITLRVAPERLDALVLSLRALGDLKSQQISAADITKEYTDLESELAADRAMQDRLLDLIKSGKGSIKDLLAAETELGTWRTKIEKAEGEIRYYNGQIALSTLTITLTERDIQTPAAAYETETGDMGIEADDVEKARDAALKAVDDVKGRVIQAELKRLDAGQLQAMLVVDIPPESAGATIDRLKQLGRVARLAVDRQTVNADGSTTGGAVMNGANINAPVKTERRPTRLQVSIYNLANIAARRTTSINLAADDVETAYAAALAAAKEGGGRVIVSSLDGGDPTKAAGTVAFEVSPEKFEAALSALRHQGEVIKLSAMENPDTANTTDTKQAITVQIVSLASVMPRESMGLTVAVTDVRSSYAQLLAAATAGHCHVINAQLNQQNNQRSQDTGGRQDVSGVLELDVPRDQWLALSGKITDAGETIDRTANRSPESQTTTDGKIRVGLTLLAADKTAPRETTRIRVEVADVDKATADAQAMAIATGGRVIDATVSNEHDRGIARVVMDVPLTSGSDAVRQLRSMGTVRGIDATRDSQAPSGKLAHAVVSVEFVTADAIVADTAGPGASIKQGLTTAVKGLLISLQWIVVGLCLLGPWAVIGWIGWKLWKRRPHRAAAATVKV